MSGALLQSTPQEALGDTASLALALALMPLPIAPERRLQLQRGVMARVQGSALAHRDLTTVRREDGVWTAANEGLQACALSAVGGLRVDLLKLEPHAVLPWPQDARAQEVLVLDGTLLVHAAGAAPVHLSRLNQVVVERAAGRRLTAGPTGTALYVRRRMVDLDRLPAAEAQWWAVAQTAAMSAAGQACPWSAFLEGADAAVLQAHGDVASMLIRIAPGATLPDHGHSLEEDCFMLEGDLFLGDILMRAGDYQLARAGGRHVGIASDTGGLFYFHGAVPPSASGAA